MTITGPNHNFQVVLFDLGSTLMYFDGHWPSVFRQASGVLVQELRKAGFPVDPATFPALYRQHMDAVYRDREADFTEYTTQQALSVLLEKMGYARADDGQLAPAIQAMYAVHQAYWQLEEDTLPTLEQLRGQGYRLGAISNASDDQDVQTLIDKGGFRSYMEVILTSAAAGIRKPDPRIFRIVLDQMEVEPAQAVMVGDTLSADVLGAHNLGMPGIWITRRADQAANQASLETIHPDATIATLSELPGVLAALPRRT